MTRATTRYRHAATPQPSATLGHDPDDQAHGAPHVAKGEERLTLTIVEACQALGVGETTLRQMIRVGQLPMLRIGRRVLIPRQAIATLVAEACSGQTGSQVTQITGQ